VTVEERRIGSAGPDVLTTLAGTDAARLTELLHAALERNRQLEHALESRIVIEQAKGVLIERLRVEPETAFAILRRAARSSRRRLHDVASDVVHSRATPREVTKILSEDFGPPRKGA
jgi:ANTAR domain-containing protein